MSQTSSGPEVARCAVARDIQRATRERRSAEEKARIVLDGLRGGCARARAARAPPRPPAYAGIGWRPWRDHAPAPEWARPAGSAHRGAGCLLRGLPRSGVPVSARRRRPEAMTWSVGAGLDLPAGAASPPAS